MGSDVLDRALVLESCKNVSAFNLFYLSLGILLDEFVDVHETSANSDENLITLLDLDVHSLLTKLINAFRLSEEHDFQIFGMFWVGVEVLAECLINTVVLVANVDCLSLLKIFIGLY